MAVSDMQLSLLMLKEVEFRKYFVFFFFSFRLLGRLSIPWTAETFQPRSKSGILAYYSNQDKKNSGSKDKSSAQNAAKCILFSIGMIEMT